MKLNLERSPLVLLGAWNQAIFSPDWVKRKIFPETPNLTVELLGFPPTSLRFIADEMLLGLEGPRLRLASRHPSSASFAGVERTGRLVLERLP